MKNLCASRFESVSILLPVINETVSLRETVETVLELVPREQIRELLVLVCTKTTPAAMAVISGLLKEHGDLVVVHHQTLPFLGGALREGFALARGSHVLLMASDLETEPKDVPVLLDAARANPEAVIATTRWQTPGQFKGYSPVKLVCNWLFQKFFSFLYNTRLTDLTFGYRVYPTELVQGIRWEECRHPFLLESMVKPLRLGVKALEVPTSWRARIEGESQNPFFRNFAYFRTGLKVRFSSPESLLAREPEWLPARITAEHMPQHQPV